MEHAILMQLILCFSMYDELTTNDLPGPATIAANHRLI